jgi:energy-coupling factor transporter ATP-binding protein EcfA2
VFLKSLTLRGFKSFPHKTGLSFEPGITVIVGPNGSGKSNIVDALAWVLGSHSPKSLRGGQMADVIFAGSPERPPLGLAEVTLIIDNEAGLIPVPDSEIAVGRVVYRSGESQYLVGGKNARLLDIQELLSDTGIGRALHTVVGQGQLEDVLVARPEERRQLIEEAAGIAKHRRRKDRAVRKLASLDQDLLRLRHTRLGGPVHPFDPPEAFGDGPDLSGFRRAVRGKAHREARDTGGRRDTDRGELLGLGDGEALAGNLELGHGEVDLSQCSGSLGRAAMNADGGSTAPCDDENC